jgi:AcrR family transcriptional regulator
LPDAGAGAGAGDPRPAERTTATPRGEQTRERILETALALFRERGYEETTMRAVAEAAGVAVGNAYYYFKSKEHLIQEFYARSHAEHLARSLPILEHERDLRKRLLGVMHARIDVSDPYHRFAGVLFRTAADPASPLNPFSPESRATRDQSAALMGRTVLESSVKVPPDVAAELPRLLWFYEMGVVLFWIHDDSPGRRRTRRLVDRSVDLVARLIVLSSNPLLRPVRKSALRLLKEVEVDDVGADALDAADDAVGAAEAPGRPRKGRWGAPR